MTQPEQPRVHLISCASWYLCQTAKSFETRGALAGLWISDKNRTRIDRALYHRCWPFHLAMKPFYHALSYPILRWEPLFYRLAPIWNYWLQHQTFGPAEVVQAIGPFATEAFAIAEQLGALKVFDAPNSHPVTQRRLLQEEYQRWAPGRPTPRELDWYAGRAVQDLAQADVVVCPSRFVLESMIENGIPENRCLLAPFGVDAEIFQPRTEWPKHPRFLCVGTICLRKGHPYLFRAMEKVRRLRPDAELICVGNYRPDFDLERPRWAGTFTHLEELNHQQLADLMRTCTAFVFPSIEEGYARVIVEAMACGLPVIATHESGATTDLTHGREGLIVPRGETEALAEAMLNLAEDRDLNMEMGRQAARTGHGASRRTWQEYGDLLLSRYRQDIRQPQSGRIPSP